MPLNSRGVWYPAPEHVRTLSPALSGITAEQLTITGPGMERSLREYLGDRQTLIKVTRSTTQASTITVTVEDTNRAIVRSDVAKASWTLSLPTYPVTMFKLVQVTKSGNATSLTFEDYYVWVLRRAKGALSMSAAETKGYGTGTRGWWVQHLCALSYVPCYTAPRTSFHPLREPMTRGSSNSPDESSWDAITRVSKDIQLRTFSEGPAVWCGPDWWFLTGITKPTLVQEWGAPAENIDFDVDVGKPVQTAKISAFADTWTVGLARPINIWGCGAADGMWLVTEISRDNLDRQAITVSVERFAAELAEPDPQGAGHQVSFTAH